MSTSWTKIKSVSSAGAAKPGMSEEKKEKKTREQLFRSKKVVKKEKKYKSNKIQIRTPTATMQAVQ